MSCQLLERGGGDKSGAGGTKVDLVVDDDGTLRGIRCPKCRWRPRRESRWYCDRPMGDGTPCGCAWNTFETRGRCPSCSHEWSWTACLQCAQWSAHEDWYGK